MKASINLRNKVRFFSHSPFFELYQAIIKEQLSQSSLFQKKRIILNNNSLIRINYWDKISAAIFTMNPIHNVSEIIGKYISYLVNSILRKLLKMTSANDWNFSEIVQLYLEQNKNDHFLYHSNRFYKSLLSNPTQLFKQYFSRNIFLGLISNSNNPKRLEQKIAKKSNQSNNSKSNNMKKRNNGIDLIPPYKQPYLMINYKELSKTSQKKSNMVKLNQSSFGNSIAIQKTNKRKDVIQLRSQSLNNIFNQQKKIETKINLNKTISKRLLNSFSQSNNINRNYSKSRMNRSIYTHSWKSNDNMANISKTIFKRQEMNQGLLSNNSNIENSHSLFDKLSQDNKEGHSNFLCKIRLIKKKQKELNKPKLISFAHKINDYFSLNDLYY